MKLNVLSWLVLFPCWTALVETGAAADKGPTTGEGQVLSPAYLNQLAESLRTNLSALRAADARVEAARANAAAVHV